MRLRPVPISTLAAVALLLLAGCASTPSAEIQQRAAEVKIYEMDQTYGNPHEVVRRLWVGSSQAALQLPTYPTKDAAVAALRTEAATLGADGLVNVYCLDQGSTTWWSKGSEPAILCYGIAVRPRRA